MFIDLLGVSDQEVWRYGQQLRQMAKDNACDHIRFSRICDLVDAKYAPGELDEELYLERASKYRHLLVANTPSGFNVIDAISNDPDISKTYKGYKKFLKSERDDRNHHRSHSLTEKENAVIAKKMISRGMVRIILTPLKEYLGSSITRRSPRQSRANTQISSVFQYILQMIRTRYPSSCCPKITILS